MLGGIVPERGNRCWVGSYLQGGGGRGYWCWAGSYLRGGFPCLAYGCINPFYSAQYCEITPGRDRGGVLGGIVSSGVDIPVVLH